MTANQFDYLVSPASSSLGHLDLSTSISPCTPLSMSGLSRALVLLSSPSLIFHLMASPTAYFLVTSKSISLANTPFPIFRLIRLLEKNLQLNKQNLPFFQPNLKT